MAVYCGYKALLPIHVHSRYSPRWNSDLDPGTPVTITYKFSTKSNLPEIGDWPRTVTEVGVLDDPLRHLFRKAIDKLEAVAGVNFVETPGPAMLNVNSMQSPDFLGFAQFPRNDRGELEARNVMLREDLSDANSKKALFVMLHELGHAVGLAHPHEGRILADHLDNDGNTVMSYNRVGGWKTTYQKFDLTALDILYGEPVVHSGWEFSATRKSITIKASAGEDTVIGVLGDNRLFGLDGDDFIAGREGDDVLRGGAGNDRMFGGFGADLIVGGDGNDRLYSRGPNKHSDSWDEPGDRIFGKSGKDRLFGSHGDSLLNGGKGNDRIEGWRGDEILIGGDGDDYIVGGSGRDFFFGGKGADILVSSFERSTFKFRPRKDGEKDVIERFHFNRDTLIFTGEQLSRDAFTIEENGYDALLKIDTGKNIFEIEFTRMVRPDELGTYFDLRHDFGDAIA